ncbi:MAG TPA: enoyl-CoA hydratase [Bordetella sp.]
MEYQTLVCAREDWIATVTLNRPDRMNALTAIMEAELRDAMEAADADPLVRVIVLTGAGRAFCAGMDMDELEVLAPDDIRQQRWMRPYDMNRRADYQSRYGYFPALRKPVIAAINGAAAGLGLVMALYSDVRFASTAAVFATAFAKRGLIAEHGIAWILPRIVGQAHALDLLLSSRKIGAEEALRMNLVGRLCEPAALMPQALAYARDLATLVSPRSLCVMKRQVYEAPFQGLAEATVVANREMYDSISSDDFKEGVSHFLDHRPPRFTGA